MNGIVYNMGCMLLDLEDPSVVRGIMHDCLMTPECSYERVGMVSNVIFPTAAIRREGSDELRIYYGAADTCIGLAIADVNELVEHCIKDGAVAKQ